MKDTLPEESPSLEAVQEQFEVWRAQKSNMREPIPEHLWQKAAKLCQAYPVSHVCKRLRVSYASLKERTVHAQSEFMHVDIQPLAGQWHIECVRSDGARLSIFGQAHLPDIDSVLGRFLA